MVELETANLEEEFSELSASGELKKQNRFAMNANIVNGYTLNVAANTPFSQPITNPFGQDAIIVGVSLINQTANADNSAAARFTFKVNNNSVLDAISAAMADPTITKINLFFPLLYDVTGNGEIKAILESPVATTWSLNVLFRLKKKK